MRKDPGKNSYGRRVYELVHDKSLSRDISQKLIENKIHATKGCTMKYELTHPNQKMDFKISFIIFIFKPGKCFIKSVVITY